MKTAIIIPARYGSTRFPGKPLAKIGGQTMLSRVVDIARKAADNTPCVSITVATEDERIAAHAEEIGVDCLITDADCPTGSDRALAAVRTMKDKPDIVINLQGDAPFTPPEVVQAVLNGFSADMQSDDVQVVTPAHQLRWEELDALRESKKTTPFSGTTVTIDKNGNALWFSKNIIPALRKEDRTQSLSPVYQHIGLYGYRTNTLETFCALPQGQYEALEGLEQLRLLENGIPVRVVPVGIEGGIQSGIDSPEDLERAEKALRS